MALIVYHGTGGYAEEGVRSHGLRLMRRGYVRRKCVCTTTEFKAAERFAFRKTTQDAFLTGRIDGVVLEFLLSGHSPRDHETVVDPGMMQDEHEIAVYNPKLLALVAIHRYVGDAWVREHLLDKTSAT